LSARVAATGERSGKRRPSIVAPQNARYAANSRGVYGIGGTRRRQ
jgi:hypothetical protein